MSIAALTWVSKIELKPSSVKFVLFCFADCSNETGICFPSVDHVCSFTSQDRKTVIGAIAKLEQLGYLHDTGERRGRTRQIKVYALKSPKDGTVQPSQSGNSSTVPNAEPLPQTKGAGTPGNSTVPPANSTVFPNEGSRKRDTDPSGNHQEPSENQSPLKPPQGGNVSKRKRARSSTQEPPEFAEVRKEYPSRSGGQRWDDAVRAYIERRAEGYSHDVIIAGIRRYRDWCVATETAGTERVQQAATFLGRNKGFLEPWSIPNAIPAKQLSPIERVRAANGVNRDERVVAEQFGPGRDGLGNDDGHLRESVPSGFRRISA